MPLGIKTLTLLSRPWSNFPNYIQLTFTMSSCFIMRPPSHSSLYNNRIHDLWFFEKQSQNALQNVYIPATTRRCLNVATRLLTLKRRRVITGIDQ